MTPRGDTGGRRAEVRDAALTLFAERGYLGTSMDDIGRAIGIRGPSLYNHVGSKQALLQEIVGDAMERLLADQRVAVASTDDPVEQLRRAAEANVRFHARFRREAYVGNRDIFSLEEPARAAVIAQRDAYEQVVVGIIERGVGDGVFEVTSVRLAAYAILEMGIGVATWFREDGPISEAEIAYQYGEMALRVAGASHTR